MTRAQEELLRAATVRLVVAGPGGEIAGTGFFVAPGIVATCAHVVGATQEALPAAVRGRIVAARRDIALEADAEWYFRKVADDVDLAFLRAPQDAADVFAPLSAVSEVGDPLWTFGHPAGRFREGQSAAFSYQGPSRLEPIPAAAGEARAAWEPGRVVGTPVGGGYSGSAVLNRRTGGIAGMLCFSDEAGSAHMVPAEEIVALLEQITGAQADTRAQARWLETLGDDQIVAGAWRYPGPRLRRYLGLAARAAAKHPFPGAVPDSPHPPLTTVYVRQQVTSPAATPTSTEEWERYSRPFPAEDLFVQSDDSVIVAGPGAGKSSLLRTGLIGLVERWQQHRVLLHAFPVRVQALDLAEHDLIPQAIAASVLADLSPLGLTTGWEPEFFAAPPVPGVPWLVLVDGFDEVTDVTRRAQVLGKIAGARLSNPDLLYRFVIATRPLPGAELRREDWQCTRFLLQPFAAGDLARFAGGWFTVLGVPGVSALVASFTRELRRHGLNEMARTPLMATMLCQVYAFSPDRGLPGGRYGVYERFIELLQQRQRAGKSGIYAQLEAARTAHGPQAHAALSAVLDESIGLIARLAAERRAGNTATAVSLLSEWTEARRPAHLARAEWAAFLAETLRRSGLVTERSGDFVFLHQTIRDYLAAQYAARDEASLTAAFEALLGPDYRSASRRIPEPPRVADSLPGFLIAAGRDDATASEALCRLAERGGFPWAQFIALCAADRSPLPETVTEAAIRTLTQHALDPASPADRPWEAIAMLGYLDPVRQGDALVTLATGPDTAPSRRWEAVNELAALGSPRLDEASSALVRDHALPRAIRWGVVKLAAQASKPYAADLLADLITDASFRLSVPERFERNRRYLAEEKRRARRRRRRASFSGLIEAVIDLLTSVRLPRRSAIRRRQRWRALVPAPLRRRRTPAPALDWSIAPEQRDGGEELLDPAAVQRVIDEAAVALDSEIEGMARVLEESKQRVVAIVRSGNQPGDGEQSHPRIPRQAVRARDSAEAVAVYRSQDVIQLADANAASLQAEMVFDIRLPADFRASMLGQLATHIGVDAELLLAALISVPECTAADRFCLATMLDAEADARAAAMFKVLVWDGQVEPGIRIRAARRLAEGDRDAARRLLRGALTEAGHQDRNSPATMLRIGLGERPGGDVLAAALIASAGRGRPSFADRRAVAQLLADAGDLEALAKLTGMAVRTGDEATLWSAHMRLMRAPAAEAAHLLGTFAAASSVPAAMRWQAARRLAEHDPDRGARLLHAVAAHPAVNTLDRRGAAIALASVPGRTAADLSARLALKSGDVVIRLGMVGRMLSMHDPRALDALAALGADPSVAPSIRLKAARRLALARDARAPGQLAAIAADAALEEHERLVAAQLLLALDPERAAAVLRRLAEDATRSEAARQKAILLLGGAAESTADAQI